MRATIILTALLSSTMVSCVPSPLLCFLSFSDYTKTYDYNFSKEALKDKIVAAYSYDESILQQNLGKTLIENNNVNKTYRKSVDVWLDKSSWNEFKLEIRQNTADTLNLIIGKLQSSKQIQFQAIVQGDKYKSSLTIHGFTYRQHRACKKDSDYYLLTLSERIENKFISKLK